jgi:hypothetical protein
VRIAHAGTHAQIVSVVITYLTMLMQFQQQVEDKNKIEQLEQQVNTSCQLFTDNTFASNVTLTNSTLLTDLLSK